MVFVFEQTRCHIFFYPSTMKFGILFIRIDQQELNGQVKEELVLCNLNHVIMNKCFTKIPEWSWCNSITCMWLASHEKQLVFLGNVVRGILGAWLGTQVRWRDPWVPQQSSSEATYWGNTYMSLGNKARGIQASASSMSNITLLSPFCYLSSWSIEALIIKRLHWDALWFAFLFCPVQEHQIWFRKVFCCHIWILKLF